VLALVSASEHRIGAIIRPSHRCDHAFRRRRESESHRRRQFIAPASNTAIAPTRSSSHQPA
jgi:hypothetical protein